MWVLLDYVATEVEADIISGLLQEENIPIEKKYPGIGNLKPTLGITNGVEVYVPEEDLWKAKVILEAFVSAEINDEE